MSARSVPTPAAHEVERQTIRLAEIEIARLKDEILKSERAVVEARARIEAIIVGLPKTFHKKYRLCLVCQEWTLDRFSSKSHVGCECCKPQCTKHTASKDPVAQAILAELMYGND